MSPQSFMFAAIGISCLVLVGFVGYLVFHVVKTLAILRRVLKNIDIITKDVKDAEQVVKNNVFGTIVQIVKSFTSKKHEE